MVKQQQKLGQRNILEELKFFDIQKSKKTFNTYTPLSTSQAHRSVTMSLNKEETLSEHSLKTSPNNLDVNQLSGKTEHNSRVYVLNMRNKPLMPCTPAKARHLLKDNKAEVVSRKPFTIKMLGSTGETKQNITLGIDTGFKTLGFSAVTSKDELISGELELRTNISKLITERKMYRVLKRSKLWYRKARSINRVNSKPKGWLAPNIKHKLDTHIKLIKKIQFLIPISKIIVETAQFDVQKIINPDIKGEKYQQGVTKGFDNVRAYVFYRDNYTCQICGKKLGILQTHHIKQCKDGGSDKPDNLATVHEKCHKRFHVGKIKHTFKKPKTFKEMAMMNTLFSRIIKNITCNYTFGHITKRQRLNLGLDKTHYNDAFVIAGGTTQVRSKVLSVKQIRRNNRCLQCNRKGFKPSIRKQRYNIQPNDLVKFDGEEYISRGVMSYGKYVKFRKNIHNIKYGKTENIELIHYGKGLLFTNREVEV